MGRHVRTRRQLVARETFPIAAPTESVAHAPR